MPEIKRDLTMLNLRVAYHFAFVICLLTISLKSFSSNPAVKVLQPAPQGENCYTAFSVSVPIESLDISKEAKNHLLAHGLALLGDVVTTKHLSKIQFFQNEKNRSELEDALERRGLHLGMKIKGWQMPVFILPIDYRLSENDLSNSSSFSLAVTHSRIGEFKDKLRDAGVVSIGDLVKMTKTDLLKVRGIGKVFASEIEYELSMMGKGLRLNMEIHNWPPGLERIGQLEKQLQLEKLYVPPIRFEF